MAVTDKGVWDIQDVRDKQLISEWSYTGTDPHALWVWGDNNSGGLGLNQPDNNQYSSPVQLGTDTTWTYLMGGAGDNKYHFAAIKVDGTLYTWGKNDNGQLGINLANLTARSSPVQVPGTTWKYIKGRNGNVAVKTDGTLWAWGANQNGPLGQDDTVNRSSPMQIGTGTDWDYSSPYKISHGSKCACAVKTDGTLWCWGYNNLGQLGVNDKTDRSSPVQIPGTTWNSVSSATYANIATKTDGTLWSWGNNDNGYLGLNNTIEYSSPTQIGTGTDWGLVDSDISRYAYGAIKTNGTLWTWGANTSGSLGINQGGYRSSPCQVPGTTWKQVAWGDDGSAGATKTDGTLWMWANNAQGQLGQNNETEYSSPRQVPGTTWNSVAQARLKTFALKQA